MGAVVFAFREGRSPHRPWQNHELAEFYRAIDILGRAGVVVVPDMGISDEGDPWFAFCRGDTGDVVVHIARIDGLLVATSIASKEIIRGAQMRNIVDAVTRIAPLGVPVADADRRLFLHPAVVLTAFIAAALAFTKQAEAQEAHSGAAAKGAEPQASTARMVAAPKTAAGEMFGVAPVASGEGNSTSDGPTGIEASLSLAALISAAAAVLGPATGSAEHDPSTMQSELLPSARPYEHSLLHPLTYSLIFPAVSGDAVAQESGSPQAASTVAANWHSAGDVTPGSAALAVPAAAVDLSAQSAAFQPSQPASDHFTAVADAIFDHLAGPPAHIGTVAVTAPAAAQTSSVAPATPDPTHGVDLSTISPVALAVLLGWSATGPANAASSGVTSSAAASSGATSSQDATSGDSAPPADASKTAATATSADVASPASSGAASSGGSAPTADASDTGPSTHVVSPSSSVSALTTAGPATSPRLRRQRSSSRPIPTRLSGSCLIMD